MNSGSLVGFTVAAHPLINKLRRTLVALNFSLLNISLLDLKKEISKFRKRKE